MGGPTYNKPEPIDSDEARVGDVEPVVTPTVPVPESTEDKKEETTSLNETTE